MPTGYRLETIVFLQTRLDAYGMLCEDPRTTEVVTQVDLSLVELFLQFNINNQSPAFRQHVVALTKKVLCLSVCMSVSPSVCSYVCPSICLSVSLSAGAPDTDG